VCHNSIRKLGWSVICIPLLLTLGDIQFLDSKEHSKPQTQCVIWSSDSSTGGDVSFQKRQRRFREALQPSSFKVKQSYQSWTQNPEVSKVDASRPSVSEQWQCMTPHSLLHKSKWYLQKPQSAAHAVLVYLENKMQTLMQPKYVCVQRPIRDLDNGNQFLHQYVQDTCLNTNAKQRRRYCEGFVSTH